MTSTLTPDYLRARTAWHAVRRRLRRGRPVSVALWRRVWFAWAIRRTDLLEGLWFVLLGDRRKP